MSNIESKGGISWLTGMALIAAGTALVVALGVRVFVQWEHNQALQRQADWNARTEMSHYSLPSRDCGSESEETIFVSYTRGGIVASIPVTAEGGTVMCGPNGYTLNGEAITKSQVSDLMFSVLARETRENYSGSNPYSSSAGPVIDIDYGGTVEEINRNPEVCNNHEEVCARLINQYEKYAKLYPSEDRKE